MPKAPEGKSTADLQAIDPISLASFAEPIWHRESLRRNPDYEGFDENGFDMAFVERHDGWRDVQVARSELLAVFPPYFPGTTIQC